MKPHHKLLAILLISAAVVSIPGYHYAKSSAVAALPFPRVAVQQDEKAINLAAAETGKGGPQAPSALEGFRNRIMKAKGERTIAKRMAVLSEAVQTLDPSQIKEALAEVETMKDYRFRSQLRGMLISRWGESDAKAALAYAQGLEGKIGEQRYSSTTRDFSIDGFSMTLLFDSWLRKDFSAAKAWVEGLPADSWV